ncbi:MAG: 4-hydroxy-3-methylbut-2-enyl diphosphate reductase [Verrucomicrobiota bacterium]
MEKPSTASNKGASRRPKRVNVRKPDVMERVKAEVEDHYRSKVVDKIREAGGEIAVGNTTVRLAKQFGFCYGVERAIDLAYAARRVFADNRIFLIGEIIHNPEVNRQLAEMGIVSLTQEQIQQGELNVGEEDVVIVPAFGAETSLMAELEARGVSVVDTTCGDVMRVWKRVRKYAKAGMTSIIHGKATHEETRATSSRAMGVDGAGHYLVVLTLEDVDYVCRYIESGGDRGEFLDRFRGAYSEGFDPDVHLDRVGVANQTTMLKSETEELQRRLEVAVARRDGGGVTMKEEGEARFESFDTICGATQERQDALYEMLRAPMDMLLVVGGYNSSNTTHLVEIGQEELPTFFVRDAGCLKSLDEIVHFDLGERAEKQEGGYSAKLMSDEPVTVGVTAGASCPNNLIEATIVRIFELRGFTRADILSA